MSEQHTPGPWIVQGPHDAPWVATADHKTILPNTVADARLIAAAPDLLAALEAFVAFGTIDPDDRRRAREAIAKARGI